VKLLSGLLAGAIAAIVASLVSLPLDAPDDLVFNTGTVTVAALVIGIGAGLLWLAVERRPSGRPLYLAGAAGGFGVAIILAAVAEQYFDGALKYMLPLAALVFIIAAPIPPFVSALANRPREQLIGTPVALVAALAIGFGLAGVGDGPSGKLSLPGATVTPQSGETLTEADIAGETYTVVSGESKLTYTVREKLAILPSESDAVGSTTAITGEVTLDGASTISVDLSTLESDQDRRDNYIRDNLFQAEPAASFIVNDLGPLPDSYTPGDVYTAIVSGAATIRGVSGPLMFEVEALLNGDELQVLGTTDFVWADFDIPPPNISGIVRVQDNVHIEILIIARAGAASPA
jgi:polyisoprenoid-binding protein YceI